MSVPDSTTLDDPQPRTTRLSSKLRVALSLFDQGVVSIATYVTGVLVSRATPVDFGLYTLVFTLWIFGSEMHSSLVSTPQMLKLPTLRGARGRNFNGSVLLHQLALSLTLTLALLAATLVLGGVARSSGSSHLAGYAIVTLLTAISIGPIALRNFARNYCFATRDVPAALALDLGVSFVQLGGVALAYAHGDLHRHWWLAVVIAAAANLVSSLIWLALSRRAFAPHLRRAIVDARRNWPVSRFIFLSSLLWTAGMYLYPWMIYEIAGRTQAGVWGACFTLAALGNPIVMGIQNYMGPAIAHAFAERDLAGFRHYVIRCTWIFVLLVLPACVMMAMLAEFLLTRINGGAYAGYGYIAGTLGFSMLLQGMSFPTSRGLFSLGRAGFDTAANVAPLVILATLGTALIVRYGVMGAAVSLMFAQIVGSVARVAAFLYVSRQPQTRSLITLTASEVEAA